MRALVPAALLVVFAFACGTLVGGTGALATVTGHAVILTFALWGAFAWRDPLLLGKRWSWFVWVCLGLALLSDLESPVSRAGWTGLALAPALLFLPAAIARCWRRDESQVAALSLALVVVAVSAWSIYTWLYLGLSRAALPLGHHNLLAAFLVPIVPLSAAGLTRRGAHRWVALLALVLGVGAVLATRSLDGAAALAVELLVVGFLWKGARGWVLMAVLLVGLLLTPRASRVLSGADSSLRARTTYVQAGASGILRRPILGWGPGSVPWTISMQLEPRLGVNPASQVIGDLHCLPLQWAYEMGLAGLAALVALAWLFVRARVREDPTAGAPFDRRWIIAGVAGLLVEALSNSQIEVVALSVMLAVLCGAWLSAGENSEWRGMNDARKERRRGAILLLAGALVLLPLDSAHLFYSWAHASNGTGRLRRLEWATKLDPHFPLYRFRLALSLAGSRPRHAAQEAFVAASEAHGLAPLWLTAGLIARQTGAESATKALLTACRLDRLAPLPPFFAALTSGDERQASRLLAQSFLLEPSLAAAQELESRHWLFAHGVVRLLKTPQAPLRWRLDFKRAVAVARRSSSNSASIHLVLDADQSAYLSFSVYAFRRAPWPVRLASVALRRSGVDAMSSVPRLAALRDLPRSIGQALSCGSD